MDELDVKILRALLSERAVAPSTPNVKSSLRAIASRLGADDMTVNYRYRKLQESGCLSTWTLLVNPFFLGYRVADLMMDVQAESAKPDMIRKLKLIHEITGIVNFYGKALWIIMIYSNDESRSRTIELISRITNPERIIQSRMPMPQSHTEHVTHTDVAIIRALSKDARKPSALVAKELGLSAKTVRKRVDKLREENTIFTFPILNVESIPGLIPVYISYSYSKSDGKSSVDRAMLAQFDSNFITGNFANPDNASVVLSAPTMADVQKFLDWTRSLEGIASARADIPIETFMFPEKLIEILELKSEGVCMKEEPTIYGTNRSE